MYNNWNNLLDKAKIVANVAGKKTEEVVETSKLKLQGFSINTDIQTIYEKMGSLAYRDNKTGSDSSVAINKHIAEIDELLSALADLESKIAGIKKIKKCPNCGANCNDDSLFCSRCGAMLHEPINTYCEEESKESNESNESNESKETKKTKEPSQDSPED